MSGLSLIFMHATVIVAVLAASFVVAAVVQRIQRWIYRSAITRSAWMDGNTGSARKTRSLRKADWGIPEPPQLQNANWGIE
ncbi:MAG: hypothetical protein AAF802_21990 [Planctomycetota bacterium]